MTAPCKGSERKKWKWTLDPLVVACFAGGGASWALAGRPRFFVLVVLAASEESFPVAVGGRLVLPAASQSSRISSTIFVILAFLSPAFGGRAWRLDTSFPVVTDDFGSVELSTEA